MAIRSDLVPAVDAAQMPPAEEFAAISATSPSELRMRFRQLYRCLPPDRLPPDLLARLVAHRLQEQRIGRLDRGVAEQLDRLAKGQGAPRRLKPGTVLMREHGGTMHEVMVVSDGFLWNGETHASLSTIARRITGTSWNGPRFFGHSHGLIQRQPLRCWPVSVGHGAGWPS